MVCSDCQSKGRRGTRSVTRRDRSLERLRTLSCASCGRLLPAPDSTERLLGILSGLSRFGLAPEGRPVLMRARIA
jgi:hypothetical protein